MNGGSRCSQAYGPAAICRMDDAFIRAVGDPAAQRGVMTGACLAVVTGAAAYGFAFGVWRSPLQGVFSAVKMPALFFAIVLASALINAMLAQLAGARLSLRQVCLLMLLGMATTAALMGALSPVALFFVFQAPPPDPAALGLPASHPVVVRSMRTFWALLLFHIAVIGASGLIGNIRLYRLLRGITGQPGLAARVLAIWIAASGFVGCELSWLFSPFLCKPNYPAHLITRTYFDGNFYEHVYRAIAGFR